MKKNKSILLCWLLPLVWQQLCAQPYTVAVTTTAIPPVNAVISQYVSSASVNTTFLYNTVGVPAMQVLAYGRIECLSPSPFTIAVNPSFTQQGTISLTPGVPVQLSATQRLAAFGFFNDNNLVATGVNLSSLKDANNNIQLPAGVYRVCFYARQFDAFTGQLGNNVSDPNLGCGTFTITGTQPSNSVFINTIVLPPVNPLIGNFIFAGGVKPTIQYNNANGGSTQVKLFGKIERLSPAPFTLALNAGYAQQQPVTISTGVPLQLSPAQVRDAFGNFADNNLTITGISLNDLKDKQNNLVLPDGTYRICFYARYFDNNGLGGNASDPALGCGTFTVCAKAAAPQFTVPISNYNINSNIPVVNATSPVVFAWTPPNTTCGGQTGVITYNFEIHELLASQTVTDAINNPPVFSKTQLPATTFILDTNLYKNVLVNGKQYVTRVKAVTPLNAPVVIDNNGYSRIEAFAYGDGKSPVPDSLKKNEVNNNPPANLPAGECAGVKAPSNTSPFAGAVDDLKDKDLAIGNFRLHPLTISKNSNGTYKGDGYVVWSPFAHNIQLRVKFDSIKVNTDKAVYDGVVNTTTEAAAYTWKSLAIADNLVKAVGMAGNEQISDLRDYVNKSARLIDQVLGNTPVDMPLGWNSTIEDVPVTIAIMGISFSPKGTNMNMLTAFNSPETNGWFSLAGTNFCITPTGMVVSNGTLYLPNDRDVGSGSGNGASKFILKGCSASDTASGTYLNLKNNKFERVVVRAELSFPKNVLAPEDKDSKLIDDSAVVAKLFFTFKDWNDWMASVQLPNFQIKDVKGLSFQPSAIYYDHSATSNPAGFAYPKNYLKPSVSFMGLYIQQLKVLLPDDFKTFNDSKNRTSFIANNLVLEDDGISVYLQGKNVIDLKTGNLGGWGFSLTNVEVDILKNTFRNGIMDGQLLLPVSSTPLDYHGDLHLGKDSVNYAFTVKPSSNMAFDIWKATVNLNDNSYFEVKKDSLGTAVTTLLNGNITIDISDGAPALKFEAVKFDSIGISNRNIKTHKKEFWVSPGTWAFASPQKSVSGFPASLDQVLPYVDIKSGLEVGLKFKLSLGIGGADKTVIGASANLALYGALKADVEDMRPSFSVTGGIRADSVRLFGNVGPLKVDGYLAFYKKDATYGTGLKGHVEAEFPFATASATAQFGNINNFNYWYIDGCIAFANPIPIPGISVVGVNGFGGGAYYNMKLQNDPPNSSQLVAKSTPGGGNPGTSMSGIKFIPDAGSAGIRATVLFSLTSGAGPKAMNAKVTLGAEIKNGAFQNLNLSGDVYVFTNPPQNDQAVVTGHVDIIYNIPDKKFSLDALITGKFAVAKLTVPVNMYAGPDGWYFKIGDPWAQKVTLDFPKASTAFYHYEIGASAYFVVGSLINPQLPPLPAVITSKLGLQSDPNIQSFIDQLNAVPGSGLMFGAEVHGSVGFNVAIIYAEASAILGFDMMLKNFDALTCNGNNSAGWQNWYALGQLYAYLDLDVGLQVDVWFFSGKVSLAKFTAGAVLRGGLPNPTWMEGAVAVSGEVLGGLVKVNTSAHFSIGDKCYPDPDPLKDIKIISDYGPKTKGDVFDYPYVASNVGLDMVNTIAVPPTSAHPDGETRLYRFRIRSFRLLKNGTTPVSTGNIVYENSNTTAWLKRDAILDAYTNYTAEVVCYAEQFYENEQRWDAPYNDKEARRKAVDETTTFSFKTGAQPEYVPDQNVAFCYPVNKQRFVLKQEFNGQARLQLEQAQTNILNGDGKGLNAVRKYQLYFIQTGTTDTIKSSFTYNDNTRAIEYSLPATLKNNTVYRTEFWSFSGGATMTIAGTSVLLQTSMSAKNIKGIEIQAKNTQVQAMTAAMKMPKPVYTLYFRTSQYNTLSEKINSMGNWNAAKKSNGLNITNDAIVTEHFDEFETKGFTAPNGKNVYPPLLNNSIAWDNSYQNDKFAADNLYANSFTLAFKLVKTDYGVNEAREFSNKPVYTLDYSRLLTDKPLSIAETGEPSTTTTKNGSIGISMKTGYSVVLPAVSTATINNSSSLAGGYQSMIWSRENFLKEDYNLLRSFGLIATIKAAILQNQLSTAEAEKYLGSLSGDIEFTTNSLGGSVTMPWNRFYYLYTDPKYMAIVTALKNMSFTDYPKGKRNIRFGYRAGVLQSAAITKTFTY